MPDLQDQNAEKNKSEKKRLRVSSSTSTEDNENDAIVELTAAEFRRIISRVVKLEEEAKKKRNAERLASTI